MIDYFQYPDENGYFGEFGGCYIPETLMPVILEIQKEYAKAKKDTDFLKEINYFNKHYTGRPSPLYYAKNISKYLQDINVFFKRDELNHTGAHKINHVIGQVLLAKRMNKTRIIAETGAGQHGVATATICAMMGLECVIYMGAKDVERQQMNVKKIQLLGGKLIPVHTGKKTLKDALNEAMRDWVTNVENTYYLIGTVAGPHPFPQMIRDFQSIIGKEVREQFNELIGGMPDVLVACIGGGSNALGLFYDFLNDPVELIAVEAGGKGLSNELHAASLNKGSIGVLHGNKSYFLQDNDGNIKDSYSISAGLDYPGIGPEHAFLFTEGRVKYKYSTDKEAVNAFKLCSKLEGIIPALEPSHALAYIINNHQQFKNKNVIVNICGRGDKDLENILNYNDKI